MQILITHGTLARTRVLQLGRGQLLLALAGLVILLMLLSGTIYHMIFLKAAREGWPVVSQIVRFVVRDEIAQRDRFMRENLDAFAVKVGEMQAKLVKLEAMGDRVSGLAGVKVDVRKAVGAPVRGAAQNGVGGQGGPFVPMRTPSLEQLQHMVSALDDATDQDTDLLTYLESRLLERRMQSLMIPNSKPVDVEVGSGFGFRPDPFTGRPALHTGLDFPAETGTAIHAAAGGVVRTVEWHPAYGHMVEIDHGNGLVTRYAHTSKVFVKAGDLVKRGQVVAAVGTTGRSTGPHLHFEVLVEGVPQDPDKFLAGRPGAAGERLAAGTASKTTRRRH
jgi:murein DD-endopeptidase MepM/ murein hydrolase activator NlpD